jgi:carboxypeptidase Q
MQIFISYNFGQSIKTGASGTFTVDGVSKYITSHNLIAETRSGDHNNVITLGAHTDSVPEGPGINDNGSGVISILRVAEKIAMYSVKNAVRFCFWTAEEVSTRLLSVLHGPPNQFARDDCLMMIGV